MSSQSPTIPGPRSDSGGAGTGLFKRRNAFWKIDGNRAGSVSDVPETKKLMGLSATIDDGPMRSSKNKYATNNMNYSHKSNLSINGNRNDGDCLEDAKEYKKGLEHILELLILHGIR